MDYLQYENLRSIMRKKKMIVLNLIINGLPSILEYIRPDLNEFTYEF